MVMACPYTPNIWKVGGSPDAAIDAYTTWLFEVLLPRLRIETPVLTDAKYLGVDGVSLGGYASLGVGVRKADEIGSIGCVQAAISTGDAEKWTERLTRAFERSGPRPIHLLTSTQDVFRAPMEALDRALTKRGVAHTLRVAVGPHDQPFLRGPGSVEMLLWHARALA
jgi:enterochelin esterase-like enzyme